jgi:hypothetical protein
VLLATAGDLAPYAAVDTGLAPQFIAPGTAIERVVAPAPAQPVVPTPALNSVAVVSCRITATRKQVPDPIADDHVISRPTDHILDARYAIRTSA